MKESFIRQRVEGAEVLKIVDKATIRKNGDGWQTTLQGSTEDGRETEETFNTRVSMKMAENDVPKGVEITYELENKDTLAHRTVRLLKEHNRGNIPPIPVGTVGTIVPKEEATPLKNHYAVKFDEVGIYYVRQDDAEFVSA